MGSGDKTVKVKKCVNLMPGADGALVPAGAPVQAPVPAGWSPLTKISRGGYEHLLVSSGTSVGFVNRGKVENPVQLDGNPQCVEQVGDYIIVMSDTRAHTLRVSDNLQLQEVDDNPAMPILTARAEPSAHYTVPPILLGREYAPVEALSASDTSRLRSAAIEAYESIDREVRASGMFWHPVIAYVRALDINGREIVATEPRVLCHPAGQQWDESLVFSSADSRTTGAVGIEVARWSMHMIFPDAGANASSVATYEVVCSPMLYAADPSLTPFVDRPRRADNDAFCSLTFQRSAVAAPSRTGTSRAIYRLLGGIDRIGRVCISHPAATCGAEIEVSSAETATVAEQLKELGRAISGEYAPEPYSKVMFRAPHSFAARHSAQSGSCLMWGDLRVNRFRGWDIDQYAVCHSSAPWHGCVEVEFADGSNCVTTADRISGCPVALSPVVSYPSPDAVRITFTLSSGGIVKKASFPLTPDPSGKRSVYVESSLKPYAPAPTEAPYVVATSRTVVLEFPGYLAAADAASPLRLISAAGLASGEVRGVTAMHSSQSSWDYGRTRFYAFSPAGIHSLSVDISRGTLSLSLLDGRVVAHRRATASCEDGVAAVASGDIVLMSGSRVSRIADIPGTEALVWVHSHHELWCIGRGFTRIICFDNEKATYDLDINFDPESSKAGYLKKDDDACIFLAGHAGGEGVKGLWEADVQLERKVFGPVTLEAGASGVFDRLAIDISRLSLGTVAPSAELRLEMRGELTSAVRRRMWLMPCSSLRIRLETEGVAYRLSGIKI